MTADADARPRWRTPVRWIRALLHHLRTEHTSPGRLAAAVAVGLFVGSLPIYGLHFPICVGLAVVLRLNKATTYLAANVSNPIFLPFLVFAGVQVGTLTLTGAWLPFGMEELEEVGPARFLGAWVLGSIELGAVLAAIGAVLTLRIARGRRDPRRRRVAEIAARYRGAGRWVAGFVAGKLRADPIYREAAEHAGSPARVLDLGCGYGQLAALLALEGAGEVIGLDRNGSKVAVGRRSVEGLRVRLEEADVCEAPLPDADLVLLVDVLHYLAAEAQDALLVRAAEAVRPGGRIWVREMVRGYGLRSGLGILSERLLALVRWNRASTLCFRAADDLARGLEAAGIECDVRPMWAGTPYANVLLEGRKPHVRT